MLLQFLVNGIISGSVYAIVAAGFALVYYTTRIFHICYASLFALAPYMVLIFYNQMHFPFPFAVLIAISITSLLSIFIDRFVYMPIDRNDGSSNAIFMTSIGAMIVFTNLIALFFGKETKIINPNIPNSVSVANIVVGNSQLYAITSCTIIIIIYILFLKYSNLGINVRALRDDAILFRVFGHKYSLLRIAIFGISGIFVSISGILVAYDVGMDPYVGMPMLLNAIVAIIVGGMGRFEAPLIGGIVIGILQSFAVLFISARWQDAVTFIILILFLFIRPQGILGEKHRTA